MATLHFENLIHTVVNKMVIELCHKNHVLCIVGYWTEIIISITNKYLLEGVESDKAAGTVVNRVCSLVEIRTPVNKPKLGNT